MRQPRVPTEPQSVVLLLGLFGLLLAGGAACGTGAVRYVDESGEGGVDADADADVDPDRDADEDQDRRDGDRDRTDADEDDDAEDADIDERPGDIAERLEAIPGMTVTEQPGQEGYRYFELYFEQPIDHERPGRGTFVERMSLLHRSTARPVVLVTTGYDEYILDQPQELTLMLGANQLAVEHRFFGTSTPEPLDWLRLTIWQAASDVHRIVQALRPIYRRTWLTTGASKGGMTAVFHRRFFPDDVDGTVAYVAPISFGAPDERYIPFMEAIGPDACRQRLLDLQVEALERRDALVPLLDQLAADMGWTFTYAGGTEGAFESSVVSLAWTFWQYAGVEYCPGLPSLDAPDEEIFWMLDSFAWFEMSSDDSWLLFLPYYYQAATELGYPADRIDHIADLLRTSSTPLDDLFPGVPLEHDPRVMADIASWVATRGSEILFVYGEWDPWTGGAFELGEAFDSFSLVVPQGTHYADIASLGPGDRATALDALERWSGVRPSPIPAPALRSLREAPRLRTLPPPAFWR